MALNLVLMLPWLMIRVAQWKCHFLIAINENFLLEYIQESAKLNLHDIDFSDNGSLIDCKLDFRLLFAVANNLFNHFIWSNNKSWSVFFFFADIWDMILLYFSFHLLFGNTMNVCLSCFDSNFVMCCHSSF